VGAWDRVKEAFRRDWEQTWHDLSIHGGHELNQEVRDTVKQIAGKEPIPGGDRPNPPRVLGEWIDVELPMEYGFGARAHYREYAAWTPELEKKLQSEWEQGRSKTGHGWAEVREHVRRGFEAKH
jgi:hypothetical protein